MESELQAIIKGQVLTDAKTLAANSHDASIFEARPAAVVMAADVADIKALVSYVAKQKVQHPELSLTARGAGTDMSGGAISDSIVVSTAKLNRIGPVERGHITCGLGAYYRDFEAVTLAAGHLLPSFPASKQLCTLGGMVADDAGGEKSLRYGKTHRYVTQVKAVLADGQEHTFTRLSPKQLKAKLAEEGTEADIVRRVHRLLSDNRQLIERTKPKVSKNSTGYNVWGTLDGQALDMPKLLVGSQGTLGILTEATFELVPTQPLAAMTVGHLESMNQLGEIVAELLKLEPSSLESFDDHTLRLALRYFPTFRDLLGWPRFVRLLIRVVPWLVTLSHYWPKLPKLVLLVEFEGNDAEHIARQNAAARQVLTSFGVRVQNARDRAHEEQFWLVRRESFSLLRKNVKDRHAAPFIDDIVVPPPALPQFLPRLTAILDRHRILFTVAGHVGEGNFHIIPLMDLRQKVERDKLKPVLAEVNRLALEYGGSLSGEHNDGLVRGPWLAEAYPPELVDLFKQIKLIFDPLNIFNPHKKTDATEDYTWSHLRRYDQRRS